MRPTRLVLALVAVLGVPAALLAGKGPPPPLDGPFFFVDKVSFDKITSLANVDQAFDEFCLAGRAVFIDSTTTLNRRVEIDFASLGSIEKENAEKVDGLFTTVDVTLTVYDGPTNLDVILFGPSTVVDADCRLEGSLRKAGDQDRASLLCDLGPNLSAFGKISEDVLATITFALGKKKTIKVDVPKGRAPDHPQRRADARGLQLDAGVPHHGRRRGLSPAFVSAARPRGRGR